MAIRIPGQSVLGSSSSVKMCSNVPAHASRLVRKSDERLKIFLRVAGMEECSNSEVSVGPAGRPTTVPFLIHGETMMEGTLTPRRSNLKKKGGGPRMPSGLGTPAVGVATWS